MTNPQKIKETTYEVASDSTFPPRVRAAIQGMIPLVHITSVDGGKKNDENCTVQFRPKGSRIDSTLLIAIATAIRNIGRYRILEASLDYEGDRSGEGTYSMKITRIRQRDET